MTHRYNCGSEMHCMMHLKMETHFTFISLYSLFGDWRPYPPPSFFSFLMVLLYLHKTVGDSVTLLHVWSLETYPVVMLKQNLSDNRWIINPYMLINLKTFSYDLTIGNLFPLYETILIFSIVESCHICI